MKTLVKVANFGTYKRKECFEQWFPKGCLGEESVDRVLFMQLFYSNLEVELVDVLENGSVYDMLMKGEIDIMGHVSDATYETKTIELPFEFTAPSYEDKAVLVLDSATFEKSTPNILFYSCPWTLWLFVFSTFIFVLLYKCCYRWFHRKLIPAVPNGFSEKLPFLFWGLAFGVFCEIFQNTFSITLGLQLTEANVPFYKDYTLINALQTNKCRIILSQDQKGFWTRFIPSNNSVTDFYISLLKDHKLIMVHTEEEVIKYLRQGNCNLGVSRKNRFVFLNNRYSNLKQLEIDDFPLKQRRWVYMKDSPFKHKFRFINTFGSPSDQYYRALLKLAEKVTRKTEKFERKEKSITRRSLSISQLKSAFIVLLCGISFSSFLLMTDLILGRLSSKFSMLKGRRGSCIYLL